MPKFKEIPLSVPVVSGNEFKLLKSCLDTGSVFYGPFLDRFERTICEYTGSRYAVTCVNGTAGLQVALRICGVGFGDEVIVPALTFIAPINAVRYLGAEPVFIDCDDYMNMDPESLKEFCEKECVSTKKGLKNKKSRRIIKAVMPVHVFGNPCDMEGLMGVAKRYNLKLIEDATESIGSYYKKGRYRGKGTGSIGDIGVLSFNANKIITSCGGGMIVTSNSKFADKARYLTRQAKDDGIRYVHNEIGYNYQLSNLQAAFGVGQLLNLKKRIKIKRSNLALYEQYINKIDGLEMLHEPHYGFSNSWFYALIVEGRVYGMTNFQLMDVLSKKGIITRPLWRLNHMQKPYRKNQAYKITKAKAFYNKVLNLPCSVNLTKGDIKKVVEVIKGYAKR